jgi:catechol 2,3-dioxygenase-like lactoylglutathione lyase family enzyme
MLYLSIMDRASMKYPSIDQQITFIYTENLKTSTQFYEETMGLELWLDQGSCRIYKVAGDSYLGICQRNDTAKQHSDIILTIVTKDVDQWHTHLQNCGVDIEKAPENNLKYNIYHFFLHDPDGYLIEIQCFLADDAV